MVDLDFGSGVLVALHGHGDEPSNAREWGRRVAPPGWEVVAPGAPRSEGDAERSWFSTGPRGVDAGELGGAARRIGDVVDRVRRSGRPVVVAGFSQGGALALALGQFGVEPDAVVAFCAFWPEGELDDPPEPTRPPAPVLVLSGAQDEVVPPMFGEDAARSLAASGRPAQSVVVDAGHEVARDAAERAVEWLAEQFHSGARVSLGLPVERVDTELAGGHAIAQLASAYERLGFHAAYVTDHPAPDDRWLAAGGHHALEPTVALSVAAAVTRRLRLHTNVYVLGYRNPFLAAKALASLDVVSDGRLIIGVAAGYLRPEFRALGAEFEARGARLDETLELLPSIWSGRTVEGSGDGWTARSVTALPVPVQRPHPPFWVGGNSVAAMRRAVRFGQGWSPFPTPVGAAGALRTASISDASALEARLGRLTELCEEHGRTEPLTTCFVPFSLPGYLSDPIGRRPELVEEVASLASAGIDWVALMVPGRRTGEVVEHAAALAEDLGLG